jgi:GNAT superfamily N-acetyltransferase
MTVSFRQSYFAAPTLADRVFELLELVFPGVGMARENGKRFGAPWESVSTPFVIRDGERVVSHVGLLPLPLVVLGEVRVVGGVHGVATHPQHRGQGHFRKLMDQLLPYAVDRYSTLVLTTLHPEYFEPFGFRVVPESIFQARVPPREEAPGARWLDLASDSDCRLMHRLLEARTPISNVLGVGPEKACWAFYEYRSAIRYAPDLDVAVIADRRADAVAVYDVIGPELPPFERLLDCLGEVGDRLITYFSPDRLGHPFAVTAHDREGGPLALNPGEADWVFMVRGEFSAEGRPLFLPRPARC